MDYQIIVYVIGGVVVGWVLCFLKSLFTIRKYKKEIKELTEHLNRQMKITGEGSKSLEKELERLRKENENLRISVKTLGQKPGRAELRLLNIYDSAIRKVSARVPGFSAGWESALNEAQKEYEESEKGLGAIVRKVLGPSITQSVSKEIEVKNDTKL